MFCEKCGNEVVDQAVICPKCGAATKKATPEKTKVVAGVLAILVGSLGIHKFYLNQAGMGILYLLFCWTGIPGIVGLVEGILYLTATDDDFQAKYVK